MRTRASTTDPVEALLASPAWMTELQGRRERVRGIAEAHGCEVTVVFGAQRHFEHARYLTSFVPRMGDLWVLLDAESIECVLDFDWQLEEARRLSGLSEWRARFGAASIVANWLAARAPQRIAVAGLERMPVVAADELRAAVGAAALVDVGAEVAVLRRRKSELELRLLQEAASATDAAFDAIRAEVRPGITEREIAARVTYLLQSLVGDIAASPCVVSGVDDPIPVREPTARAIQDGDTLMLDIGGRCAGYHADATRTFVVGTPSRIQRDVWDVVRRAHEAALAAARPGVACSAVHAAAAEVVGAAGHRLVHRVGHGIGLGTSFEWPSLDAEASPLLPGTTICIEPGLYVPGAGNMKLEDDLVITEDGHRRLTRSSWELALGPR